MSCSDIEKNFRGGLTLTIVLVDEGREDQNTTISGPFKWRDNDDPTLNAGLVVL